MLFINQKRGSVSLEKRELHSLANSGICKHFSVKGQILNIGDFEGHMVSVEALRVIKFYCCRVNAAMDKM